MDIYTEIENFYKTAKTEKRSIGTSVLGRNLYALKVGQGKPIGIAQYAIHGREFITAKLALAHYEIGVKKGSLWLLPMLNPDGCLLSQIGISSVSDTERKTRLLELEPSGNFTRWKANANGVDLNVNFDAKWGKGAKNVFYPSSENYVGVSPFSEPETKALKAFTEEIRPDYTLSYHTKGEEIYWYFSQNERDALRDKRLATTLAKTTGYTLAQAVGSVGGYKDWCIQRFHIPSFTIEAGADTLSHPIRQNNFENILRPNKFAIFELSGEL